MPSLEEKKKIICMNAQVIACPVCEVKGIISNMQRIGNKFKCNTCQTEIDMDKW